MQLTALDYIEIEQLTRKYAWAIDTCSNDGFDYADLYTPDGAFIDGQTGRRWQGREQLAEAAGGNGRGCPFPKMPLSHLILNLVIEPTADGAIGKSYLIYPGRNGQYADEKHHGHDGGYQDIFVKTAAAAGASKSASTSIRRRFRANTRACRTTSSSPRARPRALAPRPRARTQR